MATTTTKKKKCKNSGKPFSKTLLIQESILVWITTIAFIILAFLSIDRDYLGEMSWLAALCTTLWAAYGVSQAFYYNKSKAENTKGGIIYTMATNDVENNDEPLG